MPLTLDAAVFANSQLDVKGTRTEDGQTLSILFGALSATSEVDDVDPAPDAVHADGEIRCTGTGWVEVQVRGAGHLSDARGLAHVVVWANGKRSSLTADAEEEPLFGALTCRVVDGEPLRISLTLLAQRDLSSPTSAAACWVDSIDIKTLDVKPSRHHQARLGAP